MRSYYRVLSDPDNNFASDKTYFQVNCTGHSFYESEVKASALRHDYYLIYVRKGNIYVNEPKLERPLEAGDVVIFHPDRHFNYFKPKGIELEYYWVHFTGYGAAEYLSQCQLATDRILTPGFNNDICEGFHDLFRVFLSKGRFFDVESANKLSNILLEIAKSASQDPENFHDSKKINNSLVYIHNNISKALKVSDLAEYEHMSASHYRAVFRQVMGVSPKEYIILYKLNRACELLRQTDCTVKQVCFAVGFNDSQYFSRIFKKYLGVTPQRL